MNETETLEIPEQNAIIQAIMKRFDDVDMQLEIIRKGIAFNSAAYDKLEAKFFDARSDIANLRADEKRIFCLKS